MKKLYFVIGVIGVAAVIYLYYIYNPARYIFFPKCPFHQLTGYDCPGCGSQRAFYCLLHGNIKQAFRYNMLFVLSIPFLGIHFGYKLYSFIKKQNIAWPVVNHPLTPKIIFALVLAFWILRNIPVTPFSYLSAQAIAAVKYR